MNPHKRVELNQAIKKVDEPVCKICKLIRIYLLFALPVLVLLWSGVDIGLSEVDPQDLIVNVVLFVLAIQIIRRIYIDFIKRD
jgi:hypothetical protein